MLNKKILTVAVLLSETPRPTFILGHGRERYLPYVNDRERATKAQAKR